MMTFFTLLGIQCQYSGCPQLLFSGSSKAPSVVQKPLTNHEHVVLATLGHCRLSVIIENVIHGKIFSTVAFQQRVNYIQALDYEVEKIKKLLITLFQ